MHFDWPSISDDIAYWVTSSSSWGNSIGLTVACCEPLHVSVVLRVPMGPTGLSVAMLGGELQGLAAAMEAWAWMEAWMAHGDAFGE